MRIDTWPFALCGLLIAGCQTTAPATRPAVTVETESPEWLRIAEAEDVKRLDGLASEWSQGLAQAASGRSARAVAAERELLRPDAAQPRPALPPGSYHCRVLRLGRTRAGGAPFAANPPYYCYVEDAGELLAFTKQTGTDRPAGYFYPDTDARRLVFLGAIASTGRGRPPAYGEDRARNRIGIVERVGPFRWRLVMPRQSGDALEVMELVPALP